MFPGFVNTYKDNDNYVHVYFYPGYTDSGEHEYNNIDVSDLNLKHETSYMNDGALDIKFYNKKIIKIYAKLIKKKDNEKITKTLYI